MYDVPGTDLSTFYELTQNFSTISHNRKPQQSFFFFFFPESSKIWSWPMNQVLWFLFVHFWF